MSLAGDDLWDPLQREWLQAMGHTLLVVAPDGSAASPPDHPRDAAEATPAPGRHEAAVDVSGAVGAPPHAGTPGGPVPPSRPLPSSAPSAAPAVAATPAAARSRTDPAAKLAALEAARRAGAVVKFTGPLAEALQRVIGQSPTAATRVLRELSVDPTALRDDPAAKRALWARLRALRKAAR
jgi:hypothetical protein